MIRQRQKHRRGSDLARRVHRGALIVIGAFLFLTPPLSRLHDDFARAQSPSKPGFNDQEVFRQGQTKLDIQGADSCKACHASISGKGLSQWDDWFKGGKGVHARTYLETLSENPRSKRMALILSRYDSLGDDPTQREDCLGCHSYGNDVLRQEESRRAVMKDGVGCESCHGRAGQWEAVHDKEDWRTATAGEKRDKGMYDTRDVERWAEKCLECHLGIGNRRVSHRLMGAGHPDMSFELATDSSRVPKHWDWSRLHLTSGEGSWCFVRLWAVGQVVELRETMRRLQQLSAGTPDFAYFDCYACHHKFLETPSRAPGGRRRVQSLGEPTWGETTCVTSRQIFSVAWPEGRAAFDQAVEMMRSSLRLHDTDWAGVSQAAEQLETLADQLTQRIKNRPFDKRATARMLIGITADAEYTLGLGPMAADHAYRAIRVLYEAAWPVEEKPEDDTQIVNAIKRLRELIYPEYREDMSYKVRFTPILQRFDPDAFRGAMRDLNRYFSAASEPADAPSEGTR
jgi:hypothetical protein